MAIYTKSSVDVYCPPDSTLCDEVFFLIYPQIDYPNFKLKILLEISDTNNSFENFIFDAKFINPKYTYFITILKYILFAISLNMTIIYGIFYYNLNPFIRTFEHKSIFFLSIYLNFFNDPFCIFALHWPNVAFSVLSSFCYALFITGLIVFWSIMIRRIHSEATTPETKLLNNKYTLIIGECYR